MALKFPDKAKGIPFDSTEYRVLTQSTSSKYTSGDINSPYDVFMDFESDTLVFGYSSEVGSAGGPDHNETMRRIPRSIITFIQNEQPHLPDIGDIWVCPSASIVSTPPCKLRIFRTSSTWQCWGVNSGTNTFQLDVFDNIEPTVAAWDVITDPASALFVSGGSLTDITTADISASAIVWNNLFEADGPSAVMPREIE